MLELAIVDGPVCALASSCSFGSGGKREIRDPGVDESLELRVNRFRGLLMMIVELSVDCCAFCYSWFAATQGCYRNIIILTLEIFKYGMLIFALSFYMGIVFSSE